jgi:hypothetical protein
MAVDPRGLFHANSMTMSRSAATPRPWPEKVSSNAAADFGYSHFGEAGSANGPHFREIGVMKQSTTATIALALIVALGGCGSDDKSGTRTSPSKSTPAAPGPGRSAHDFGAALQAHG